MKKTMHDCIGSREELKKYLQEKGGNHVSYNYYSVGYKINNILEHNEIYLSDGRSWNDIVDGDAFNKADSGIKRFGLCFSYAVTENVAMWLIYKGQNFSDSLMIKYPKNVMRRFLNAEKIKLGSFQGDKLKQFTPVFELQRDGFEIELIDVVYYDEADSKSDEEKPYHVKSIRRADELVTGDKLDTLVENTYYSKIYPWRYENECRLVVTIKQEAVKQHTEWNEIDTAAIEYKSDDGKSLFDSLSGCIIESPACEKHIDGRQESVLKAKIRLKESNHDTVDM